MPIPAVYTCATLRNVTPIDPRTGRIGLGFDCGDHVKRVQIPVAELRELMRCADDYMKLAAGSQSPMSRDMSSAFKSVPSLGENV